MWRRLIGGGRERKGRKRPNFAGRDYIVLDEFGFRVIDPNRREAGMSWTDVRTIVGGVAPAYMYELIYLRFESAVDWLIVDDLVEGFAPFAREVETRFGIDPAWYGELLSFEGEAEMVLYPSVPIH